MGLAVCVGWSAAPHTVLFVIVIVLWCAAAGMLWAVSSNAGQVAAAASALLVTAPPAAGTPPGVLAATALAVAGGLSQAVLVAAWPRQRWRTQRTALAAAYRGLARGARDLAADPQSPIDVEPLIALRESFTLTERQARRRPPAFRGLYGLPERIALTLDALRGAAAAPGVQDTLSAAADVLGAIADGGRSAPETADAALERLDAAVRIVPASATVPAERLRAQLREAAALHFTHGAAPRGQVAQLRRPGLVGSVRRGWSQVGAQLSADSPIMRHALRLGLSTGVAITLASVTGMAHGYWMALTLLMVLRPETAHTYTRCVARVLGNTAGVGLATAVTIFWHPSGLFAAVLAVAFLAVAYAVSGLGYVPLSAALAVAIVFLVDIGGGAEQAALGARLLATVLGGVLAVAAHVLLPDRSLIRLRQRAGELLKAEIDYAAVVIRSFAHELADPDAALAAAWERALRARSAFEATSGSARADALATRRWLTSYRAALNAVTSACATLETHRPGAPSPGLDRRFIVAVDDYVDALRGDTPSPGQAWSVDTAHLAESDQQLREAATLLGKGDAPQRVLVAEVETITRQLLSPSLQPA